MDVREMASLGGKARKKALTPAKRKSLAVRAAIERWSKKDPKSYFLKNRKKPNIVGRLSERIFENKMTSLGLPFAFTGGLCDFWANGHGVEIKCSNLRGDGTWKFSTMWNRNYDFVAFFLIDREKWLIIPEAAFKRTVNIKDDENSESWKKFSKYLERWEPLLTAGPRKNPKQ